MAVKTVPDFLAVLQRSKLLKAEQFAEATRLAQQTADPAELAKVLARADLISWWQAGRLLAGISTLVMGKYKLIQLLGRGGMGSVFLAEHVTMNRRVALKIVPRQVSKDKASLDRFFAEARAIAALDHPNIVQAYSVDCEFERYFIVMEYVDGVDLQQAVEADGPLDFARAADYIRQAAEGLAHAHARKMVHCDIKPSNLLVNQQGVVKILDMGLARLKGSDEEAAGRPEDRVLGSVDYLSPEQALETPDFDHRADIYSLGCTLYFLLTGHPPFPEGTLAQRIVKHQTQEPRDILLERPGTPADLVSICRKMMAKRPEDRYQSADDVGRALAAWQPPARQPPPAPRLRVAAPLEEELVADQSTDSWLDSLLTAPAAGSGAMPAVKSGTQRKVSGQRKAAAAAAAIPWRERLGKLVGTRRRKIVAVAGGAVALAALAGCLFLVLGRHPAHRANGLAPDVAHKGGADGQGTAKPPHEKLVEPIIEPPNLKPETLIIPPPKTENKPEPKPPAKPETKPEVKPGAKTETKPEIKPAEKPEKLPTPTPKEPKPEPRKPDVEPFSALAKSATLPAIGKSAAPVAIGTLHLQNSDSLEVQLLSNPKGNPQFALQAKPNSEQKKNWVVTAATTEVARFWLDKDDLNFQWLSGAADVAADYLRNCGLVLAAGEARHFMSLRPPHEVPPLVVNPDYGQARNQHALKGEFLPDPAALKLQLCLDAPFPTHQLRSADPRAKQEPSNIIPLKGKVDVILNDPKLPGLGMRVLFDKQRDLMVAVMPLQKMAGIRGRGETYVPVKPGAVTQIRDRLTRDQMALKANIPNLKGNDKTAAEAKLKDIDAQLAKIDALREALKTTAVLQFRVVVPVGEEHQVELFTTKTPAAKQKMAVAGNQR